ncbi:hypothetical protein [Ornithinimicrobium faecis]|uniref:Uncharacterized protein n=1 Tax=Ornithinimicrobium faecis TaxID=2934158 RepID=A0ABY4YVA2_9MICO|nr:MULTISPECIES: hypothetical protein [unclassified Ornithinimicrobium]USQ80696.1 hypothetical protein NF556_03290 [Ornithinimicrobium sp. HY1793]
MAQHDDSRRTDDDISAMLRGALGNTDFDYESLVGGVHRRAGRIRRRRAIATGAAVAVLGPALVGGAALVLPDMLGDEGTVVGPAASTDVAVETTQEPTDQAEQTGEQTPDAPPWQDAEPPLPEGGAEPENEDLPNAWEIPDARPTGVSVLEGFGVPQTFSNYPRTVPVMGLMTCDPGNAGGVEPLAGQSVTYYEEGMDGLSIDIHVTGWEDSAAALDGLVNDDYTSCVWDDRAGEVEPWPGHEGDEDYLLFPGTEPGLDAAVVRQGDYLIAVTVRDGSDTGSETEIATEIASKQADNLEALDPDHGRD